MRIAPFKKVNKADNSLINTCEISRKKTRTDRVWELYTPGWKQCWYWVSVYKVGQCVRQNEWRSAILPWHNSVRTSRLSQSLKQRRTELVTAWHRKHPKTEASVRSVLYVNREDEWKKRQEEQQRGQCSRRADRWETATQVYALPWIQWVFDFLAIAELFLSDAEEVSSIAAGLWHGCDWVIHHAETSTRTH